MQIERQKSKVIVSADISFSKRCVQSKEQYSWKVDLRALFACVSLIPPQRARESCEFHSNFVPNTQVTNLLTQNSLKIAHCLKFKKNWRQLLVEKMEKIHFNAIVLFWVCKQQCCSWWAIGYIHKVMVILLNEDQPAEIALNITACARFFFFVFFNSGIKLRQFLPLIGTWNTWRRST